MNLRDRYIKHANSFSEKIEYEPDYSDQEIKEEAIFILTEAIKYIQGQGEKPKTNKGEVVALILDSLSRMTWEIKLIARHHLELTKKKEI